MKNQIREIIPPTVYALKHWWNLQIENTMQENKPGPKTTHFNTFPYIDSNHAEVVQLQAGFYTFSIKHVFMRLSTTRNEQSLAELKLKQELASSPFSWFTCPLPVWGHSSSPNIDPFRLTFSLMFLFQVKKKSLII